MGKDKVNVEQGIDILKVTDANFMRTIEHAIQFGKWIMMENVAEELEPSLEPLLQKEVFIFFYLSRNIYNTNKQMTK